MKDLAYHYGDLGRSEYRHSFGNRGTGGFGTGVYFVGKPISQRSDSFGYRNRPEHKVDFSEYKLFRPTSNSKAYDLHDALLAINNLFSDNDVVPDTPDDILSEYSAVTKEYFSPVNELPKDDYVTPITLDEKILWRYIDKYKDYYNEEISLQDDPLDIASTIEDNLLEDARVFQRALRKLVSALGYNYSEDKIRELIATAVKDTSDIAPSTLIMKALGYDGIDVRHLNHDAEGLQGLDNFGYGSVIYDIKSTSVIDESYIENKNKTGANMRKLINQINNVNDQDFDKGFVGTAPVSYADAVIRMRKKRREIADMLTKKTNDARSVLALKTGVKISLDEGLFESLTEESNNVLLAKKALNEIIERIHLGMSALEELLDLDISDAARSRIDDAASDIAQVLDRLSLVARKYLKESFDDEHLGHRDDVCPKCGEEPCECKEDVLLEDENEYKNSYIKDLNWDLAEYIYNNSEINDYVKLGYVNIEHIVPFEDVLDEYDENVTREEYEDIVSKIYKTAEDRDFRFYEECIQIGDNFTKFAIERDIDEETYDHILGQYIDEFKRITGIDVFLKGRYGRHVCVDNNVNNFINFRPLYNLRSYLEDKFIDELNGGNSSNSVYKVTFLLGNTYHGMMVKATSSDQAKEKAQNKQPDAKIVGVVELSEDDVKELKHRGMSLIEAIVLQQFSDYQPWEGAISTYEQIKSANKLDALDRLIEEMYPEGIDMTELNDLLWFDSEWVFNMLNIPSEDEEV